MTKALVTTESNLPAQFKATEYLKAIRKRALADLAEQQVSALTVGGAKAWGAVVSGTMLLLIDKLDTSIFTIRALLLKAIVDDHLYAAHPNDYTSAAQMFTDITGRYMSQGECADATAWIELVLPILFKLGYTEDMVNNWGTAKIRAVIPIFRALLGDRPAAKSTQVSIDYIRESLYDGDDEHWQDVADIEVMKETARLATTEPTWRDFILSVGREPPAVTLNVTHIGDSYQIESLVTEEEWEIIKRRMGNQLIVNMKGVNNEAVHIGGEHSQDSQGEGRGEQGEG